MCGIRLIIAAPLNSVAYEVALFGLAIALDVIVAVNCFDSPTALQRMSHPRLEHLHVRRHSRA